MDKYERKEKKKRKIQRQLSNQKKVSNEISIGKMGSLNFESGSEDSMLVDLESEKSDEGQELGFQKATSHGLGGGDKKFMDQEEQSRKAATLDTDSRSSSLDGSNWSMVMEEPMLSQGKDIVYDEVENEVQNDVTNETGRKKNRRELMRREKPSQKSKKNKKIILSPKIRAQKYIENKNPKSHAFKDKSVFKKLIFIFLEGPLNILRRLTIPASDGESW
eukprot:CAMPEP_0205829776 /NCGR_PEP_ID=MMETSP0206-20130828/39201_1 /ASSEMBLY_ACC=CAM_ASM_000279 /TAXON_ID=36767 /ORGANISM="Euplotes focardii, Strain TN1" /LENGTH=218 /DNA_ID=CAMNT_0053132841 /DNA_START=119 /DNA_END=772 /DNA_ORIENTATION=+